MKSNTFTNVIKGMYVHKVKSFSFYYVMLIPTGVSPSPTASRGTTNCGVLTLTATCPSTMSHCLNPTPSLTAWVALTPITRPVARLVPL